MISNDTTNDTNNNNNNNNDNNVTNYRHSDIKKQTIYLKFYWFNAAYEQKVRSVLNKLPFLTTPIFISSKPSSNSLYHREPLPCPLGKCICNGRYLCLRKNFIYEIKCNICFDIYVGETHRTYLSRIVEHTTAKSSNVFLHLNLKHYITTPTIDNISHKILRSGCINTLHRKYIVSDIIRNKSPAINVQYNR